MDNVLDKLVSIPQYSNKGFNMRKKLLRSCGCRTCMRGRRTTYGHVRLHQAEKQLRQQSRINIEKAIKGNDLDLVDIIEVSTDYTD